MREYSHSSAKDAFSVMRMHSFLIIVHTFNILVNRPVSVCQVKYDSIRTKCQEFRLSFGISISVVLLDHRHLTTWSTSSQPSPVRFILCKQVLHNIEKGIAFLCSVLRVKPNGDLLVYVQFC